jgi:hypothetical protein
MSQQDTPQQPAQGEANASLDLPAGMFRAGDTVEAVTLTMQRRNFGLQNTDAHFSEIDGMAIYEGDIALGPADAVRNPPPDSLGIGIKGENFRWPEGVVPYVTVDALAGTVKAAIDHWEARTPIRFVKRTNEADYVSFEVQTGCWSWVGRQGGMQVISLGAGCGLGAAIHEIGHCLGLWHEQSRSDRDQFIEVLTENIKPGRESQFDKHIQDGTDLGAYDFASIMHYPETAFSKNNQLPTIRVKGGQSIGQRNGLSQGDIASIKMLYPNLNWPAG